MSKNKKNKKNTTEKVIDKGFVDEQVLSKAIVKAYFEIEDKKKENEQKLTEKEQKEWLSFLGQEDYPADEKWLLKKWHRYRNDFVGIWRLLFIKAKDVKDMRATFGLISMATALVFRACKWLLYVLSLYVFILSINNKILLIMGTSLSIMIWMIARLFRIAAFEIDKMRDTNMLLTIFSAALTFVTIIIPVITFFLNKI
ncbi:MAG: hypothetical protein IJ410_09205 [Oscillospiraceae bacterium]|nr:hypothetical protein [Oscillospiraceae bacterium]